VEASSRFIDPAVRLLVGTLLRTKVRGMCDDDESSGGGPQIDRRRFVLLTAVSALGLRHALVVSGARADASAADMPPVAGDRLVAVADPQGTTTLRVADIPLDRGPVIALPVDPVSKTIRDGSRLNRIALVRTDPTSLDGPTRDRSAEGVLAFSAVCTHEACFVAGWLPAEGAIVCPCHSSRFNVRAEGEVLGGPAPRALPSLPLKVDGGELAIAGPFSATPGVRRKND
jgi:Rieske Fe-S protein